MPTWLTGRRILGAIALVVLLAMTAMIGSIVETVDADEIVVIQNPFTGNLAWYTTPGPKPQWFGSVTAYKKRSIYKFEKSIRFNDGAHGKMIGSIQYELPTDDATLNLIHSKFRGQEAVQNQLVATVVDKCTYMTGPTMSSQESYAAKRNLLISYVEDQVANGIYRTKRVDTVEKDPLTGADRVVSAVEIAINPTTNLPERIEDSVLRQFNVKPFNFSVDTLSYDDPVEKQIESQQKATMDVQLAMAEARKADQRKLTTEAEGAAEAAKAKWAQEAIRAKEVTRAEQEKEVATTEASKKLEVAKLDAQEAAQYKQAQILRAEADAEYKRRVMAADGALQQKLDAMIKINQSWANAFQNHQGQLVPSVVMGGGSGGQSAGNIQDLIQLMTAKAAKDVGLDLSTRATPQK